MDSLNILIGFEPFDHVVGLIESMAQLKPVEPIGTSSKDGKLGLNSLEWDFVGWDFILLLVTHQRVVRDNFLDKMLF